MDVPEPSHLVPSAADLHALSARVAELERAVAALQGAPVPEAVGATRQLRDPVVSQAVTPPPPPPPPTPVPVERAEAPAAARPQAAQRSLEGRLGSQVFPIVGIFTLICGAAYFLKLAIERGYIGPPARVLIGLVVGTGVVVWSERFRRRGPLAFSYALKAVGTAVLYLSLWAAFRLYHLLPAPVALGAMVLVTAWNAWMAVAQDAELLAGYALAGGLLTPLLLSTGGSYETFLFTYLAAIALGVVYVLRTRAWSWLLLPTVSGVIGYFIGWYSRFFHQSGQLSFVYGWNAESSETAFFAFLFFAVFAIPTLRGWSGPREPAPKTLAGTVDVLLPLVNAAFLALALYSVFEDSGLHASLAFVMVGLGALFLGVMRLQRAAMAGAMYLAAAVVCLTIAVPLKASGHALTTAWLVEGLILFWAGTRFADEKEAPSVVLWVLSLGGYGLGLLSLLAHWGFAVFTDSSPAVFFSSNAGAAAVAVLTLGGAAWLAKTRGRQNAAIFALFAVDGVALLLALREVLSWGARSWVHRPFANGDFATAMLGLGILAVVTWAAHRLLAEPLVAAVSFVLGNLVAVLIGVREISALFSAEDADLRRALAISAFLMVYGAGLLAIGFMRRSAFVRWQALVLLVFTVGKVFLYDIGGLNAGYRVASLMGLGAVLLGVSYAYQKDWLGLKTPAAEPAGSGERVEDGEMRP